MPRILVADDDPVQLELRKMLLEAAGRTTGNNLLALDLAPAASSRANNSGKRLREWMRAAQAAGIEVGIEGNEPGQLTLIESTLAGKVHAHPRSSSEPTFEPVSALGRKVTQRLL